MEVSHLSSLRIAVRSLHSYLFKTPRSKLKFITENMAEEVGVNKQVWVFGYGSLLWKTNFPYQLQVTGYVKGYARRFWQGSAYHRGVPGAPGRVATLVENQQECTHGVAFKVKNADVPEVMAYLNKREKDTGGYTTRQVLFYPLDNYNTSPFEVLLYIATENNPEYLGPAPASSIARQIVNSAGPSGCNVEYLMELAKSMKEIAPIYYDEHLFTLEAEVVRLLTVNGTKCNACRKYCKSDSL